MPDQSEHCAPRCPIVITGVAAAASLGVDAETIWRGVLEGRCGIGPMPDIESALPTGCAGGQAAPLPAEYCPLLPREVRYLRWTVEHSLRDAQAESSQRYPAARRLAVLGTTLHGIRAGGRFLRSGRFEELNSFLAGATAGMALQGLGVDGGSMTTCSACSSSLSAIALGVTLLETGQADQVIAGGYDAISEYSWAGFNSLRLIAAGPSRPFCINRQGMKVAEGYGIVILEREDAAQERGAPMRAVLAGWGESADAHHLTQPHPLGKGALSAMRQALGRASVRAEDLSLIAAHATGTPDNDGAEFQALSRLLGDSISRVPVVCFKSVLGHTLGGAGAVELVLSCMALRDNRVPACPNIEPADVEFPELQVLTGRAIDRDVSRTLNTSLGFGGANTCVVLTDPGKIHARTQAHGSAVAEVGVLITGLGIVLPGAIGPQALASLLPRRNANGAPEFFDPVDDAALSELLNVRRARRLSQYVKFNLAAATMAVRDARLGDQPDVLAATGAILGSMHGSATFCHDYYAQIVAEGALAANPVLFAEGVPNAAAAHLSTTLGLTGACQTIIGSRTAGLDALALGTLRIRSGVIDTLVIVAAEASCEIVDRVYQASGLIPSPAQERGATDARGAGAVAFVIESSQAAAARGVVPYAAVQECAWSSPSPGSFGGPARAVASALSRLPDPGEVIGTGSGTWLDRAERLGIRRAGTAGREGSLYWLYGELGSVSPLAALASELAQPSQRPRSTILCIDWLGAASAVSFDHRERRLGVS